MSRISRSLSIFIQISIVFIFGGCSSRWATQWDRMAGDWRLSEATTASPQPLIEAVAIGHRGFRFGETLSWVRLDLSSESVSVRPEEDEVIAVEWAADPDSASGVAFRLTNTVVRVLLTMDRSATRTAAFVDLILQTKSGEPFARIPVLSQIYDLDNMTESPVAWQAHFARCVAAEARRLADAEIRRVAKDRNARRLENDEAEELQEALAAYLAFDGRLCRRP